MGLATLVVASLLATAPDADAAIAHRQANYPAHEWGYHFYFTTATVPKSRQDDLARVLNFHCAALCREKNISDQLPQPVILYDKAGKATRHPTVRHIDTRLMRWEQLPNILIAHYPYAREHTKRGVAPLIIRADWFCANIGDSKFTKDSRHLLLYGKVLQNKSDFFAFWKFNAEPTDTFGFLEGASNVKRPGAGRRRNMESRPAGGRDAGFETFDSEFVVGKKDALRHPETRPPLHDANEILAPMVKYGRDAEGKPVAGVLWATYLSAGNSNPKIKPGTKQDAAPIGLVEDSLNLRGYDIADYYDCHSCHTLGLKRPNIDAYREALVGGVLIKSLDKQKAKDVERYYESAFYRDIERGIEDFAAAMRIINGWEPEENARQLREQMYAYDADLTLFDAARELYTTPEFLKLAIAYYVERYKSQENINLARLAERQSVARVDFEFDAYLYQEALRLWAAR
jgi:hypothetical protein